MNNYVFELISGILGLCTFIALMSAAVKIVFSEPKSRKSLDHEIGDILSDEGADPNPFHDNSNYASYIIIIDKKFGSDGKWYYQYKYCDKLGNSISNTVFSGLIKLYKKKIN